MVVKSRNKSKNKSKSFKYILLFLITGIILIAISQNKDNILRRFYPLTYGETVYRYANEYKVDPLLVFTIIRVESSFNVTAQSKSGAKGLMQLTDQTGEWGAKKIGISNYKKEMLFNPEYNIRIGCWYLNNLINQFDGNLLLALTAYNGGSGNVEKWLKNKDYSNTGTKLDKIPFSETEKYVQKIKKDYEVYKSLYK